MAHGLLMNVVQWSDVPLLFFILFEGFNLWTRLGKFHRVLHALNMLTVFLPFNGDMQISTIKSMPKYHSKDECSIEFLWAMLTVDIYNSRKLEDLLNHTTSFYFCRKVATIGMVILKNGPNEPLQDREMYY
jgi:hypothetical protein